MLPTSAYMRTPLVFGALGVVVAQQQQERNQEEQEEVVVCQSLLRSYTRMWWVEGKEMRWTRALHTHVQRVIQIGQLLSGASHASQ
jgi:hypothetical protein